MGSEMCIRDRSLPAEFERKTVIQVGEKRWEKEASSLLIPQRLPRETLEQTRRDMGSYAYAAQYMQHPAPSEGGLIKKPWLRYYQERPSGFSKIIHSWDTASKDGVLNDYTACTVWGVRKDGFYLLDALNQRLEFPQLRAKVRELGERDSPDYVLIEDKASGQALIQDLRAETSLPIKAINPKSDKLTRLSACTPYFETGNVYLPEYAHWLEDYIQQLCLFPNAKLDDMVDSTSQFLIWAKENNVTNSASHIPATHDHLGMPTFNTMVTGANRGRIAVHNRHKGFSV